jgi:hypothetical protein
LSRSSFPVAAIAIQAVKEIRVNPRKSAVNKAVSSVPSVVNVSRAFVIRISFALVKSNLQYQRLIAL